jgi:CRISPR-associated protein Csm3
MEIKYENIIHRVKGVAEHPRPLERIPAGVEFDFNMSFKVFEGDADDLIEDVYRGLRLIELDALGGNSSRGSGQVRFDNLTCDGQSVDLAAYPFEEGA